MSFKNPGSRYRKQVQERGDEVEEEGDWRGRDGDEEEEKEGKRRKI